MSELQLTVNVGDPELAQPLKRDASAWRIAIRVLKQDTRFKHAKVFKQLPLPREIEDGWYVVSKGVSFRCLQAWVMFPTDGGPPGFRGRVDVLLDA